MKPLDAINEVKKVRLRKKEHAELELMKSRKKLKELIALKENANTKMEEYQNSVEDLQRGVYQSFEGKPMDIHDRFRYLMSNYNISSRSAEYEEKLYEAEEQYNKAKQIVTEDEEAARKNRFQYEKILEMRELLQEEHSFDAIVKEEDELDEFLRTR